MGVNIDLARLNSIGRNDAPQTRTEQQEAKCGNITQTAENATDGQEYAKMGNENVFRSFVSTWTRGSDASVYMEYQENIRRSEQLQTEILKGAKAGEDIYSLFLKAVEAISNMTANTAFRKILTDDIGIVYGRRGLEPAQPEEELSDILQRLDRLREEREGGDNKRIYDAAIRAHEERARDLEERIRQSRKRAD